MSTTNTQQAITAALLSPGADGITASAGWVQGIDASNTIVTATGTPSGNVQVAPRVWVVPGPSATTQGPFLWTPGAASVNVAIPVGDGSNPRIDLLTIQVTDPGSTTTPGDASFVVVPGTATASPVAPSLPSGAVQVATIARGAGDTTVSNAQITNDSSSTVLRTRADVPRGRRSTWRLTANSTASASEIILASLTFSLDTRRRYVIRFSAAAINGSTTTKADLRLRRATGGSVTTSSTQFASANKPTGTSLLNDSVLVVGEIAPGDMSTGTVTVGVGLATASGGSGTVNLVAGSAFPALLTVDDVGV